MLFFTYLYKNDENLIENIVNPIEKSFIICINLDNLDKITGLIINNEGNLPKKLLIYAKKYYFPIKKVFFLIF